MKSLSSMLLLLLFATGIAAQSQATRNNPPGVVTSDIRWHAETINPKNFEDPFRASEQQDKWQRETIKTLQTNAAIERADTRDLNQRPIPTLTNSSRLGSLPLIKGFVYRFKLRNVGEKKIVRVVWEYVFLDPATKTEAARHRFTSATSIPPGKRRDLMRWSRSHPIQVVDVRKAGRSAEGQYSEDVVIKRIQYADGSVWIP